MPLKLVSDDAPVDRLKLNGSGRDADCDRTMRFYFDRRPTDDEMRWLHEVMSRAMAMADGTFDEDSKPGSLAKQVGRALQAKDDRIAELEEETVPQMIEALTLAMKQLDDINGFCSSDSKPCGDPDAECPIAMGEWFSREDRAEIEKIRSVLAALKPED